MKIIKDCVLLLKAERSEDSSENDKYELMLTEKGFTVKYLKTLQFTYKNLEELKAKLENADDYTGLIFTTPRTVKAIQEIIGDELFNSKWKAEHKLNYVVGETTFFSAKNELGLVCKGKESGNAHNLANIILNDKSRITKPFLFPCGNLKTDVLMDRLNEENIKVEAVTVYDTIASPSIDDDLSALTLDFKEIPEYFVYFSPSGVKSTIKHFNKFGNHLDLIKFIAIGPTTENALKQANLKVESVAMKPTPLDLLNAILS